MRPEHMWSGLGLRLFFQLPRGFRKNAQGLSQPLHKDQVVLGSRTPSSPVPVRFQQGD